MLWSGTFEVISKGPEPTGWLPNPAVPSRLAAAGSTMPRKAWLAASRNWGYGAEKFTVTVSPDTVEPEYGPSRLMANSEPSALLSMRSNVYLTALAVSGVPSENFTPGRIVN